MTAVHAADEQKQHEIMRLYRAKFNLADLKEDLREMFIGLIIELEKDKRATDTLTVVDKLLEDIASDCATNEKFKTSFFYEYDLAFTTEELKSYADWLSSPAGKKFRDFERRYAFVVNESMNEVATERLKQVQSILLKAKEALKKEVIPKHIPPNGS